MSLLASMTVNSEGLVPVPWVQARVLTELSTPAKEIAMSAQQRPKKHCSVVDDVYAHQRAAEGWVMVICAAARSGAAARARKWASIVEGVCLAVGERGGELMEERERENNE